MYWKQLKYWLMLRLCSVPKFVFIVSLLGLVAVKGGGDAVAHSYPENHSTRSDFPDMNTQQALFVLNSYVAKLNTNYRFSKYIIIIYSYIYRYRHIDTAQHYNNEQNIGSALKDIERRGVCSREKLFITTKLANHNMRPQRVKDSLEESLEKLKTSYVDLFLVHMPWGMKDSASGTLEYDDVDFRETWLAMEKVVTAGMTKSIGLSNFTESYMNSILAIAKIVPQNVQLECHLYNQQHKLREYLNSKNIACSAYSPLGAKDRPERHKTKDNLDAVLENPLVSDVAVKHGVTEAQVALRFLLQQGMIVLPKTATLSRLEENFNVLQFELDSNECEKLKDLDRGVKYFPFVKYQGHPKFPKNGEPF